MTHRTTNPKTSFFGDGRETQSSYKRHAWSGRKKIYGAEKIWATEFPDIDWNDAGDAKQIYQDLRQAGWVYSSRYGWRLVESSSTEAVSE